MHPILLLITALTPLTFAAPLPDPRVEYNRNVVENVQAFGTGVVEETSDIITGMSFHV
jgi:hypothetical protein